MSSKALVLYFVAVVAGLAFLFSYHPNVTPETLDVDEQYYYGRGAELARGTYEVNPYRPVGFPLVVGGLLWLTGFNLLAAKALLVLISSLRAPLVYALVKRISGNEAVSFWSGLGVIFWPVIFFLSSSLYSETVSLPLFLGFLVAMPFGNGDYGRWLLAGVLYGLTMIVHPLFLMFIPFLVWIVWLQVGWRPIFAVLIIAAAVVAPWSYVVSKHSGEFVLLSLNNVDAVAGSLNPKILEEGTHLTVSPSGRVSSNSPGMWIWDNGYLSEEEKGLSIEERSRLVRGRVIDFIKNNPGSFLYLEGAKLATMWGFWPWFWELKSKILFGNIPIITILLLGILAMIKWRKDYKILARLWVLPLFVSFVALYSLGSWRYRITSDCALISLSVMYIYSLFYPLSLPQIKRASKFIKIE